MSWRTTLTYRTRLFLVFALGLLVLLAFVPLTAGAQEPDALDLQSIWDRVNNSGAYSFSADLTQTTQRAQTGLAYGPSSQKTRLYMEGRTDLETGALDLTLWNGGGSIVVPESGVQIRITDGQALARRGGGSWQQIDDFSGLVAPDGDFMAMVQGAENVVRHEPEVMRTELGEMTITRFTFDINGPQYAAHMRDLVSEQMRGRGELPPGMDLELPEVYAGMTGRGELWVGEDGLPVNQELDLTFPAVSSGGGATPSTAHLVVTFSNFAAPPVATLLPPDSPAATAINQVLRQGQEVWKDVSTFQNLFAVLAAIIIIAGMGLVVRRSGSRPVYVAIALSVSFSMLFSPLLNSMHVSAYSEKIINRQAAQEEEQAEADAAEAWQEALQNPNFDSHASPLALAKTRQERVRAAQNGDNGITAGGIISATSDSSEYFDSSCETDPGSDNDGDGLTNLEECLIGTLPGAVDTDQDGVDDDLEVNGFVYDDNSSVTWYTNPLYPDTNRDGLGDGSEWHMDANNDGKPDDTDGDGLPDLWDDDNDGDGVPDDLDLSPYSTTKDDHVFDKDNPLQLILDDLGEGLITKVEFQLTPTDPDHLWYTNNVLDWADNDRQGQMQDADGLSFYDVDDTVDPFPNDLGDVRLVPMLEIEMTGATNNLPDQHTLDQFGISINEPDTNTKIAYVPVSLVTDSTGNKNVAFQGAMFYQAASTWGNAQTVRLVWLVQALVDVCETYENGLCSSYSKYNDVQVIHSYDEEWYLTGMEVSEEQGTNIALAYEDPAESDDTPLYVDTLIQMVYGLDRTFVAGADCEVVDENGNCVSGNGILDLTVTGIYTRFNHTTNGGVSDTQRWGLDNVFSVYTNTYPAVEVAMMDTVITQTKQILTDTFTSAWSATNPITPTILFAWEHNYRVVSLSSDHLSWSDNILTVDVATSGADPVLSEQENGMKWAPFAYNTTDRWFAADMGQYWSTLGSLLPDSFSGDDDIDAEVAAAKFLYMGMYSGESYRVSIGDLLIPQDYSSADRPIELKIGSYSGSGIRKGLAAYYGDVSTLKDAFKIIDNEGEAPLSKLETFAQKSSDYIQSYISLLERSVGIIGIGLLVIVSTAALIVAGIYLFRKYVAHDNIGKGWLVAAAVAMGLLGFVMGVLKPILSIIKTINGLIEVGAVATKAQAIVELFKGEGAADFETNVFGLVVSVGISVAFFLTLVISGQVRLGSISYQFLLASTIASIIVAFILFLLALNPFTAILVGLAAIIDIILFALGVNFSITGKLTQAIADALYEFDLSVDIGVGTGNVNTELVNPADGIVVGNQMIFTMPITTVITESNKVVITEDQLRSNSFVYDLDALDAYQSGLTTTHGDQADDWAITLGIGTMIDTVSYELPLSAGVNRSFIFYLDSAYDLLGESCWWIAGCDDKYVQGTSSTDIGSSFVFDIYPATVDEFVDVTGWSNGNLRIADADGDGLLPLGAGGVDPDDSAWDTDGDNLSDQFELAMRALTVDEGGELLDATLLDTDSDGIPDNEELWLATNPDNPDTDGDGLPDVEEAARADADLLTLEGGWLFPYSIHDFTRVWSDPNNADYDGDGMTDLFELTQDTCPDCTPWVDPDNPLLFSPYVYNENPVPIFLDDNTNDGFVTPGTSFVYSTTTENNLSEGILLAGNVALSLPDIFSGAPLTAGVALNSGYSETLVSELSPAVSTSAVGVLTSSMDLEALEDVVWAWDPVEKNSRTPLGGDIKWLDATAAPNFSNLYVYTALEIDGDGTQYITAYAAGNEGNPSDAAILSSIGSGGITYTAPAIACNDDGVCVVAWGEPNYPNGGIVNGFMLNGSLGQTSLLSSIRPPEYDGVSVSAPSVASDGENFMVAWTEDTGSEASTWVRQVYADGTYSALQQAWEIDNHGINPIGLEWTGSRYLAVWINSYDATIHRAEIDTTMNVGTVTTVPGGAETFPNVNGIVTPLNLSYDRLSDQALVIYRDMDQDLVNAYYMSARRLTAAGSSHEIYLDISEEGVANASYYADIAICADPQNGGWLVAWTKNGFLPSDPNIHYRAIGPDGSLRGSEQLVSTTNDNAPVAIACRTPHPLLDLEFEEETTSAIYADSTQHGHDAICSDTACPAGGVEGRFGNGVQFDGMDDQLTATFTQPNDEFTVEFWIKTSCQDCDILNHLGGNASIYLQNGEICTRELGSHICSGTGDNFADGEWHHVFHAMNGQAQWLYMDGDITVYTGFTFSEVTCSSNCDQFVLGTAGSNFFDGTLDHVVFYDRALSSDEAFKSFSSAITILDLDETAGSTTAYDATHGGYNAACSGSTCPTFGVDGIANTAAEFDGANDFLVIDTQKQTLESLVYDFEESDTSGWSNGTLSTATRNGSATTFLGDFGNQEVTLNLTNLPTHDTVTIAFDLYVLGSWDGNRTDTGPDTWEWGYDDTTVLKTNFSNQPDTTPNYQSYPAWYNWSNYGVTLYENSDLSGDSETFFADDPDLSDNVIGSNRASAFAPSVKTVAILYDGTNYSGSSWIMDPGRGNINVPDNDAVSSLRVFSGLHSPKYNSTGDSLTAAGFSETSVYHIEFTLEDHIADSLTWFFEGLASDGGQERWGLDNVVVDVQSDGGSIPLTNNSFTLSAWAKRDSTGGSDYILSQGSNSTNEGIYMGYEGNNLVCAIWGHELTYTVVNDGEWHHVACTFFSPDILEDMYLYYDGAQVGMLDVGADYSGFGETYIGKRMDNAGPFNGVLDEIGVWFHPLDDDQILELYEKVRVEDQAVLPAILPAQDDNLLTYELVLRETATGAGTEAQVVTHTLGIDADAPSATIQAPTADDYLNGTNAIEISGSASDPTSYVNALEVQVDGGSWVAATGTESWNYTIPAGMVDDGLHTVSARATDVVGTTGAAASVQFIVDDTPPDIGLSFTGGTMLPDRDEQGRWIVKSISGSASDPPAGTQSGSGLVSVEVLMQGGPNVVGNGWQTATLENDGFWTIDYVLPDVGTGGVEVGNPSGAYTVTVRATDAVNNTTPEDEYVTAQISLETNPPIPTLVTALPLTKPITTSLTITGFIQDNFPVAEMEIGFTPGSNIGALSEAVVHLPFDELYSGTQYFSDRSGSNNPAGCTPGTCPLAGQSGQRDQALQFDGVDDHLSGGGVNLDNRSFTVAAWAKRDVIGQNHVIVSHGQATTNNGFILLLLSGNQARCSFWANNLTTTETYTDTEWHHWACSYDANTGLRTLYRDGVQVAQDSPGTDYLGTGDFYIGRRQDNTRYFDGLIDEVIIHDRALEDYEITNMYEYGLTTWYTATVDNSGPVPTWSFTIPEGDDGLEGIYQINGRATDDLEYITPYENQRFWRGEIDTLAPRVVFSATIFSAMGSDWTSYNCTTTDFNLNADESCTVLPPDTIPDWSDANLVLDDYATVDSWYGIVISDTSRLFVWANQANYMNAQPTDMLVESCDAYGRCTTAAIGGATPGDAPDRIAPAGVSVAPREMQSGLELDAAVSSPTDGTVLTSTLPVTVTGLAVADAGLQSLSVTVNDVEVHSENWPVTPTLTNTDWSFNWAPPAEGVYLFETEVTDWLGNSAAGSINATVYVDTAAPVIEINPLVLTTTHQFGDSAVELTGTALDSLRVHRVQVSVDGGPLDDAGLNEDGNWEWPWLLAGPPDGATFNVSATATDLAGRTATDTENVLVDIAAPEQVSVTLAYQNSGGQMLPILPGDTLTDAVSLAVTWTAGSDGSGIAGHRVAWSQSPTPVLSELTSYPGAGTHTQTVGEAETWYAHVLVVDGVGNVTIHTQGPIYVDGYLTPDEIDNPSYHGWANNTCAIEGVDRRLVQKSPTYHASKQQRFYVSWDEAALRLYWQGANWNHDGDLFVYLDTRPGGSGQLYNPYPDDPNAIYLPGNFPDPDPSAIVEGRQLVAQSTLSPVTGQSAMGADYLVWVEDSNLATLYFWDGTTWSVQQELGSDAYRLARDITGSDTDLRLPFADIGIADPATAALGIVAVATEEESLELWATMPVRNPVNSDRVVNPLAAMAEEHIFPLVRGYFWNTLGSGLCANGRLSGDGSGPTGGPFADSDLQLTLSANPVGTAYTFINDEMAWLWSLLFGFDDVPVVPSELFEHTDNDHPPLGPGEMVTYTLSYANLGTETATDVTAELDAWYSLQLTDGTTIDLGDIPAGASGSIQITALIDPTGVDPEEQAWAALDAYVYDEQYPENPNGGVWTAAPLEWMWSDHQVDIQPPEAVAITSPDFVIPAGLVTVRGEVVDESPVPLINLEVVNGTGNLEAITCPDDTPTDGRWSCEWDASGAGDGDTFQVRIQAVDAFGQTSAWTEWTILEVDATPPDFSVVGNEFIFGPGVHHLNGDFNDERQIGSIHVCREDNECAIVNAAPNPNVPPGTLAITGLWASYLLPPELALEGESQILRIFGQDAAGNRSETFTVTYQMDDSPPALSVTYVAGFVPALGAHLIAAGTVFDGSHVEVNVLVAPPAGARQRLKATVNNDEWSFTHGWTESGVYALWVQAVDEAGNVTTVGPFTVLVGDANQVYLPAVFNNAALVPSASIQYLPIVYD